ncbi:MAG TPA: family 10 glycosylhydrolase [Verrucomicrobiae bacterium]|nr:family 10 glycosylhydrolase [Verrucomicrobiae bacterium]
MRRSQVFFARALVLTGATVCMYSCTFPSARRAAPAPPIPERPARVTELRGVWISDTTRLDWNRATADLQRAGFNTIYANLASGGAAFYPRSHALPSIVGGSIDPVARGIELAHQRGLAVHAKQIVTFMYKAPPGFQRQLISANRVMRGPDGRPVMQAGYTWLCPSQEANRQLIEESVKELVTKYPVDGIQFDYIRFCEQPSCFCSNCRREFEHYIGHHLRHWPEAVLEGAYVTQFNQWRQREINSWVAELAAAARQARPGLVVSAAVFPDLNRARQEKAQDWKLWLDRGHVDYVCTMTYTPDLREFQTQVRQEQASAGQRNKVVVGIGAWKFDHMSQLASQINATRQLGAPGFVLFSYDDAAARNFLPDLSASSPRY